MTNEEALKHLESAIGCMEYSQEAVLKAAQAADSDVLTRVCEDIHDQIEDHRRRQRRFVMVADDMRTREDQSLDELTLE